MGRASRRRSAKADGSFVCIFCMERPEGSLRSDEHVFPEAIGGTLICRDVCRSCNGRLGSAADVALTDHSAIKFVRRKFGLRGKSGTLPSPFPRGTLKEGETVTAVAWDSEYFYRFPTERNTSTGRDVLVDPRDARKIPRIVEKLRRRGRAADTGVRVVDEDIRGVITFPLEKDLRACEPCLLKVAYELACGILGPSFAREARATAIRAFLRNPASDVEKSGIVAEFRGGSALPRMAGAREEHLIGGLMRQKGRTVGYVRIFNLVDAMILVSDRSHHVVDEAGAAGVIDVTKRGAAPQYMTFRSLGWMGVT